MQVLASGFADVYVTVPREVPAGYKGVKERFNVEYTKVSEGRLPVFLYEGDLVIEKQHTLYGMYYQRTADQFAQMVRCTYGSVYVVVVDIRPDSSSFGKSKMFYISAENGKGVVIPRGFAIGFMNDSEQASLTFKMERRYEPERNLLLTPFDPVLGIKWPAKQVVISAKERYAPGFSELERVFCAELMEQLYIDTETLEVLEVEEEMDEEVDDDTLEILEEESAEEGVNAYA